MALAFGMTVPSHAQQSVFVINDADNSVPVRDVRHPALTAYHGTAAIITGRDGGQSTTNFSPAPGPGRLVIEYVSAACSTNISTRIVQFGIRTHLDGLEVNHQMVPVVVHTSTSTRRYVAAQSTRLYHDTTATLSPFRVLNISEPFETEINCTFAVSGHTVLLQPL
jgi:hypothetical protein